MDKNMVNIDDLFRQRLQGGEEKERAGAWANMSALLDKEMPVDVVPTAFNFRRFAAYFVGGLMLAALSVGGYKGYERLHSDRNLLGEQNAHVVSVSNTNSLNSKPKGSSNASIASGRKATANLNQTANTHILSNTTAAVDGNHSGNNIGTTPQPGTNSNNTTITGHHRNSGHTATGNHTAASATGNNVKSQINNADAGNNNVTAPQTATAATGNNSTAAGSDIMASAAGKMHTYNTGNITAPAPLTQHNTTGDQQQYLAGTNSGNNMRGNHSTAGKPGTATNNGSRNSSSVPPSGNSNTPFAPAAAGGQQQKAPAGFAMIKDTMQKIRLLQHYVRDAVTHANVLRVDTISVEHEIVDRLIRKENNDMLALSNEAGTAETGRKPANIPGIPTTKTKKQQTVIENEVNPASAPPPNSAIAADSKDLVPLENYKVASKRSYAWDPEHFREMVMRAKFNLAQVQFYPGLVGGINATMFGPNSMAGFQLGLSGVFVLNDRWSVLTELKYITRFNNGMTLKDNYAGAPVDSFAKYNAQGTALESMNYNRDSMEHYFNFSTVNSLELPISVRYAIKRLYLMGGINLVYNFSVSAEEVSRNHEIITTVPYNHGPLSWPEGKPAVNIGDFNSRFGIGYLLGAGYQITPSVNVDLRMTRTFWDNANGTGAQKVSADLFKSPSMQLSIGYRFRQNRH